MDIFKSTVAVYIGFTFGVAAMVAGVIWPDYANFLWSLAAILGFGSAQALRAQIDSKGWKTAAIFVLVVVVSVLQWTGLVTPDLAQQLFIALGPIAGVTVTQALVKSPTSTVKPIGG